MTNEELNRFIEKIKAGGDSESEAIKALLDYDLNPLRDVKDIEGALSFIDSSPLLSSALKAREIRLRAEVVEAEKVRIEEEIEKKYTKKEKTTEDLLREEVESLRNQMEADKASKALTEDLLLKAKGLKAGEYGIGEQIIKKLLPLKDEAGGFLEEITSSFSSVVAEIKKNKFNTEDPEGGEDNETIVFNLEEEMKDTFLGG